jgi:hypothetical protein
MTTRYLGAVALALSPFMLVLNALNGFERTTPTRTNAILGLLFLVGWGASAVALRRLRATGDGAAATAVFLAQMAGLALAAMQQVTDFVYEAAAPEAPLYGLFDTAWPLSVLFMLVVGAFALRARVLDGWRRWTPTLCGLALPLLVTLLSTAGQQAAIRAFGLYTFAAWALLAIAILTTRTAPSSPRP